jgi:hypothetical protein
MKWIIVAILVCVLPYTYLNLRYRKASPAHEPYQDNKDRAGVMRLLAAGYQRIDLATTKPMDPRNFSLAGPAASVSPRPGGLPSLLSETLIDHPLVPAAILTVLAPASLLAGSAYTLQFTSSQPQLAEQFATVEAYLRGDQLTIVPAFETLHGDLQNRFIESTVRLTLRPGVLKPGRYEVTLIGDRGSQTWPLEVQ